ncbi:MAG: three component ABC system middle component [Sporomusaceae bacterium]|nr:three component ABC system middle component [Sporomusaceae bacterium]
MTKWEERPIEVANLLNPAFCSVLLYQAIKGYRQEAKTNMPYPLLFLILPIVLHKSTRESLPRSIATKFHAWLEQNQNQKISFAARTRQMVFYTKEALTFGMKQGIINIDNNGLIVSKNISKLKTTKTSEVYQCSQRALFLGRWFSKAGDITTIFMMWGICP